MGRIYCHAKQFGTVRSSLRCALARQRVFVKSVPSGLSPELPSLNAQVQAASDYEFSVVSSGADYTLAVKTALPLVPEAKFERISVFAQDGTPLSWGFPFSERDKA